MNVGIFVVAMVSIVSSFGLKCSYRYKSSKVMLLTVQLEPCLYYLFERIFNGALHKLLTGSHVIQY